MKLRFVLILILMLTPVTFGQQREKLIISSGAYNILDNQQVFTGSLELLMEDESRLFNPILGFMFTSENNVYTSFGFNIKQSLLMGFSLSFSFTPGLYYSFRNNELGHFLEFNSGIQITYALADNQAVSLSFHHISNGGLAKFNPGAEFILISYTIPLER